MYKDVLIQITGSITVVKVREVRASPSPSKEGFHTKNLSKPSSKMLRERTVVKAISKSLFYSINIVFRQSLVHEPIRRLTAAS